LADITISIVSNNNRELLLGCLDSIYGTAEGLDVEVIVIDNVSSDGSVGAIGERFPQVRFILNEKKEGFSANHNKALRVARADFMFVLNDDTVLHPGSLKAMRDFLHDNPQAGAVGCMLLNPDGTPQRTGMRRPTLFAAAMISVGLHRLFPNNPVTAGYFNIKPDYAGPEEVESINAAAIMVKREVLEKAGYLDEGFFLFCEDVDWCIRMREAGFKLYFLPSAKITHYRGASTGGRRMVVIYHKSLFRFYRKHYAVKNNLLVNAVAYMAILLRFLAYWLYGGVRRK